MTEKDRGIASTAAERKVAMMKLAPGLLLQMIHPDGADWESANDLFEDYYAILETLEEGLGAFMQASALIVKEACARGEIATEAFLQEMALSWALVTPEPERRRRPEDPLV